MTSKFMGAFLICFSFFVHASASGSEEDRDEFDEGVAAVEKTESPTLPNLGAAQPDVKQMVKRPSWSKIRWQLRVIRTFLSRARRFLKILPRRYLQIFNSKSLTKRFGGRP